MLHFVLTVQSHDGRLQAVRSDSDEWHPAVLCAMEALARVEYDGEDLSPDGIRRHLELINPDAPRSAVQTYRKMMRHTAAARSHRVAAKQASEKSEGARLFGLAQAENIRAARTAADLATEIFSGRGAIRDWSIHYAEISRRAVRAYEQADADKSGQIRSYPVKNEFVDCSRDLQDAGRIASTAEARLRGQPDFVRFFEQRAKDYIQYQDPRRGCSAP